MGDETTNMQMRKMVRVDGWRNNNAGGSVQGVLLRIMARRKHKQSPTSPWSSSFGGYGGRLLQQRSDFEGLGTNRVKEGKGKEGR